MSSVTDSEPVGYYGDELVQLSRSEDCMPKRQISTPVEHFKSPMSFGQGPYFPGCFSPLKGPRFDDDDDDDWSYRSRIQRSFEQPDGPLSPGEVVSIDPSQQNPRCIIRQPTPNLRGSGSGISSSSSSSSSSNSWAAGTGSVIYHNALPRRSVAKREMAELGLGKSPDLWGVKEDLSAPKYTFLKKKRERLQKQRTARYQIGAQNQTLTQSVLGQNDILPAAVVAKVVQQDQMRDDSSLQSQNRIPIHMPPTSSDGGESAYSLISDKHRSGNNDDASTAANSIHTDGNNSRHSFQSFDEFAADLAASVSSMGKGEVSSVHDDETLTLSRVAVSAKIPMADPKRDQALSMDSRFNSFDSIDLTIGGNSRGENNLFTDSVSSPIKTVNSSILTENLNLQQLLKGRAERSNRNRWRSSQMRNTTAAQSKSIPTVNFSFVKSTEDWNINSVHKSVVPKEYFEKMQTGGRGQRLQRDVSRVLQTEQVSGQVHDLNALRAFKRGRDYREQDRRSFVDEMRKCVRICGDGNEILVEFRPNDTLKALKTRITRRLGIPGYQQLLVFNGKILHDNDIPLCAQNIINEDTLHLMVHRSTEQRPARSKSHSSFEPRTSTFGLPPTLPRVSTPKLTRQ